MTQQIQAELSVSYLYSLQVWNMVCISYVFAALCEYSLALYVMHMVVKRRRAERAKTENGVHCEDAYDDEVEGSGEEDRSCSTDRHQKTLPAAAQLYSSFQLGDDVQGSISLKPMRKMNRKRCSSDGSGHHNHHHHHHRHRSYHHSHHPQRPNDLIHHQKKFTEQVSTKTKTELAENSSCDNCDSNCKNEGEEENYKIVVNSGIFYTLKCHRLWKHFRTTTRHSAVDNVSRYLFPLSYFLFVLIFVLHAKSDQQTAFIFI